MIYIGYLNLCIYFNWQSLLIWRLLLAELWPFFWWLGLLVKLTGMWEVSYIARVLVALISYYICIYVMLMSLCMLMLLISISTGICEWSCSLYCLNACLSYVIWHDNTYCMYDPCHGITGCLYPPLLTR